MKRTPEELDDLINKVKYQTAKEQHKEIYKEFKVWWKKEGYKYTPENEEEGDWCNVVRYWVWKGFKAGREL